MITIIASLKNDEIEQIDLLYDSRQHKFLIRASQLESVRNLIILEGFEFVKMLQAGFEHYQQIEKENDKFIEMLDDDSTDTIQ